MSPKTLEQACLKTMENKSRVTLSWPKGQKIPTGFPTGEILSENPPGNQSLL